MRPAAVRENFLAGDRAGAVTRQEDDDAGNLAGLDQIGDTL